MALLASAIIMTAQSAMAEVEFWEPTYVMPPGDRFDDSRPVQTRCVDRAGGVTECVSRRGGRVVAKTVCRDRGYERVCDTTEY
jgi:hypothetical protein